MTSSIERLRSDARQCRDLASTAITVEARSVLTDLAQQYEADAAALERSTADLPRRSIFRWGLTRGRGKAFRA